MGVGRRVCLAEISAALMLERIHPIRVFSRKIVLSIFSRLSAESCLESLKSSFSISAALCVCVRACVRVCVGACVGGWVFRTGQ